jgi:predicted acylesterase/phospholipase RssA
MKVRIILPGGGFKGMFQLGFLHKFLELSGDKIEIDHVYGTSIGGILAPFVATKRMDLAFDALEFVEEPDDIFNSWSCLNNVWGLRTISKCYNVMFRKGLYKSLKMSLITDQLKHLTAREELLLQNVSVCSNRVRDKSEVWHDTTTEIGLMKGLELTSRLPGALPPMVVNGEEYVDGGLTELYPLSKVWDNETKEFKDKDFDGIYLVLDFGITETVQTDHDNILFLLIDLLDMTASHLMKSEITSFLEQKNVYRYTMTNTKFKTSLDFSPSLKADAIEEGFEKAQDFYNELFKNTK